MHYVGEQANSTLQDKLQKLDQENKQLTATINKLQATQQENNTQHSHLENQNRSYSDKIDSLQAKIDQIEAELSILRRKVIKQDIPLPVGVPRLLSATTTTTTTSTTSPATNTNGTTNLPKKEEDEKQNGSSGQELADMVALAESRLEEATKLREEKTGLLRDVAKLREELAHLPLDRIVTCEPYLHVHSPCNN